MGLCSRKEVLDSTPDTVRQSEDPTAQEQGRGGGNGLGKSLRE